MYIKLLINLLILFHFFVIIHTHAFLHHMYEKNERAVKQNMIWQKMQFSGWDLGLDITQICKQIGIIEESVTLNKNMLKTGVCNTLRLLKRPKCAVARTPAEWLESPNMFVFWGTVSSWVCRWRFSCLVESQFPCLVESFFDPAFFVPLGDGDPPKGPWLVQCGAPQL